MDKAFSLFLISMCIKDSFSMAKRMAQVFLNLLMAMFMMASGLMALKMEGECT